MRVFRLDPGTAFRFWFLVRTEPSGTGSPLEPSKWLRFSCKTEPEPFYRPLPFVVHTCVMELSASFKIWFFADLEIRLHVHSSVKCVVDINFSLVLLFIPPFLARNACRVFQRGKTVRPRSGRSLSLTMII